MIFLMFLILLGTLSLHKLTPSKKESLIKQEATIYNLEYLAFIVRPYKK